MDPSALSAARNTSNGPGRDPDTFVTDFTPALCQQVAPFSGEPIRGT
jgi:hypothetical protein